MKKILLFAGCFLIFKTGFTQIDTTLETNPRPVSPAKLTSRNNDHLLIQLGYAGWANKPDSINTSGLPRSFNIYMMLDFPFKSNPNLSVAIGPGIATDNIFFDKTYVGIKDNTSTLAFNDVSDTTHFKKYKLTTAWLEAPIELRYTASPDNAKRGLKLAIGGKVGTLLSAHTKGKNWQNKDEQSLINYTQKEKSKRFFNTTRFSAMARAGWGNFTLYGTYQINPLFKEGLAPDIKPFSIGLTISGL